MYTDPIADMLTRIRNGISAGLESVEIPGSNIKKAIAGILKEQGYIEDFSILETKYQDTIKVYLKYRGPKHNVIYGIQRVSTPGRRVYVGKNEVPKILKGIGMAIISTTKGLLTDEQARQQGVGGEVIMKVW
ncbi:MAG: 30S ribosomal protein S8 [Deltaproteobacteria bacterium]|nr:30S ribosomal protein S8 [Deltaproteobacteria bacterium]